MVAKQIVAEGDYYWENGFYFTVLEKDMIKLTME